VRTGLSQSACRHYYNICYCIRIVLSNSVWMALCIECSPAVQEVPGSIPNRDTSISDALCRGCRRPWSVVKPLHSGDPDVMHFSRSILRFERLAPSHTIEVWATSSLSRYSDLHASDQLYLRPIQTQPRSPTQKSLHRGLGIMYIVQFIYMQSIQTTELSTQSTDWKSKNSWW
jgi:hypothetical protein